MASFTIYIPDELNLDYKYYLQDTVQKMVNRLGVGYFRYFGKPTRKARYMSRMRLELEAYEKTGNQEHIINLQNYGLLERIAPEHPKSHFKVSKKSATRGKV